MEDIEQNYTAKDMNQIGVSRARLRYWERLGLLRPQRQPNSRVWRRYSNNDLETGRRMIRLLALGLTIDGARRNLDRLAEVEAKNADAQSLLTNQTHDDHSTTADSRENPPYDNQDFSLA